MDDFEETRWTQILKAGSDDSGESRDAWEFLCKTYWKPTFRHFERLGCGPSEAEDITQAFFEKLVAKKFFNHVERKETRFRTYFKKCIQNFLVDEWRKKQADKNAANNAQISLDDDGSKWVKFKPSSSELAPDEEFDRDWALAVIDDSLECLKSYYEARDKMDLFRALEDRLDGGRRDITLLDTALTLGMTEPNLKKKLREMRRKYKECFDKQIVPTVDNADEIKKEKEDLLDILRRRK